MLFVGFEDYSDALYPNAKENPETILCFLCGIAMAALGLVFLILHAASFETMKDFEHIGMAMLTIAPIVNTCGWYIFDSGLDPTHFYNRQWIATEIIEWSGMTTLCISYIDAGRTVCLFIELTGFVLLMVAAMFTVNIHSDRILPEFIMRWDHIHVFDTCGLFLLCVVAVGQWHIHLQEDEYNLKHPSTSRSREFGMHKLIVGGSGHPDVERADGSAIVRRAIDGDRSSSESDSD